MGAQQSADAKNDCNPCFGVPAPFKRNSNSNDPLGSPMPDTPNSRQRKPEFSSRYGGLEKEVSSAATSSFYGNTSETNRTSSRTASVHEGAVRDTI